MNVVTIASLKGGVGKTATAVRLAVAAYRCGRSVLLIDCDARGSAVRWDQQCGGFGPRVAALEAAPGQTSMGAHRAAIRRQVRDGGEELVLLDTPAGDTNMAVVEAAISAADLVVTPVEPSGHAVDRLPATLALCADHDTPAAVLVWRAKRGTRLARGLTEALDAESVMRFTSTIPDTVRAAQSLMTPPWEGESDGDLLGYAAVWRELDAALKEMT